MNFKFDEVKNVFSQYRIKNRATFNSIQNNLADEVWYLLNEIHILSDEIIKFNEKLCRVAVEDLAEARQAHHDKTLEMFKKFINFEPNEDQWIMGNVSVGYDKSSGKNTDEQKSLVRLTNSFYQSANRISVISKQFKLSIKFKPRGVMDVRNHLMEHPEKSAGVTRDTFMYQLKEGPMVKGLRFGNNLNHQDKGFKSNVEEFLKKFSESFSC